jgi:hypothetical protein
VAQQVMQIARNALPLRDLGQVLNLAMRLAQLFDVPMSLRKINVGGADESGEKGGRKQESVADVEQPVFQKGNRYNPGNREPCRELRLQREGDHGSSVDEEVCCASIERRDVLNRVHHPARF